MSIFTLVVTFFILGYSHSLSVEVLRDESRDEGKGQTRGRLDALGPVAEVGGAGADASGFTVAVFSTGSQAAHLGTG